MPTDRYKVRAWTKIDLTQYSRDLKKASEGNGPVAFSYINWDNGWVAGYRAAIRASRQPKRKGHAADHGKRGEVDA